MADTRPKIGRNPVKQKAIEAARAAAVAVNNARESIVHKAMGSGRAGALGNAVQDITSRSNDVENYGTGRTYSDKNRK